MAFPGGRILAKHGGGPARHVPPDGLFGALNEAAKIMIVDDEALNIRVVQRHLELPDIAIL